METKEKNFKKISFSPWKTLLLSLCFFLLIFGSFFSVSFFIIKNKIDTFSSKKNRYHVVLNHKYGYVDKGFSEQAVNGVCAAFDVPQKKCNGSSPLFQKAVLAYGYPDTIDNPNLINQYLKNFVENDKVNNFVMPGYTYTQFLCDFNYLYEKRKVNIISVGTFLSRQNLKCKFNDRNKIPSNLWQVLFREQYAGFHAGIYAAAYALENPSKFKDASSKKGKQIAFAATGGLFLPAIVNYAIGFKYGIQKVNEKRHLFLSAKNRGKVELIFSGFEIIGGFDTSKFTNKAKQISKHFYLNKKVSVIMPIAVTLVNATTVAALESNVQEKNTKHWVIGVDVDGGVTLLKESPNSEKIKGTILVSGVLEISKVVQKIIEEKIEKNQKPDQDFYVPGEEEGSSNHQDYSTIPDRFKKGKIWQKIKAENLDNLSEVAEKSILEGLINLGTSAFKPGLKGQFKKFLNDPSTKIDNSDPLWKSLMEMINQE